MKLVNDPETAAWLAQFGGQSEDFDWDAGNRPKNRKHSVEDTDVEALFQRSLVFVGRIIEPIHEEDRWLLLGQDSKGRHLALVFTRRDQRLRPISCRPMRRNERSIYAQAIQEGDKAEGPRRPNRRVRNTRLGG